MTEIEPCQFCGGAGIAVRSGARDGDRHWIECYYVTTCGARGPSRETREQAIADWNRVAGQRWRPIEDAPRDGTEIDIWVIPPSVRGSGDIPIMMGAHAHRIERALPCYRQAWQQFGRTVTGRRFYDDGDECLDPDDTSERATRATHWRPLPDPPGDAE